MLIGMQLNRSIDRGQLGTWVAQRGTVQKWRMMASIDISIGTNVVVLIVKSGETEGRVALFGAEMLSVLLSYRLCSLG